MDDRTAGKTCLVLEDAANRSLSEWYKCLIDEQFFWMHQDELEPLINDNNEKKEGI